MSDVDVDELIASTSYGVLEQAAIDFEDALEELEAGMKALGIDRRTSIDDLDPDSVEFKLRDAHAKLEEACEDCWDGRS